MRPRLSRSGIRGRLMLALVGAIVATLVAASLVIFPALQSRLDSDRVSDLRGVARLARPSLHALDAAELRARSRAVRAIVEDLQERSGGRIAIFDARGTVLADTSATRRPLAIPDLAVLTAKALARRDRVTAGTADGRVFAVAVARADGKRVRLVIVKRLGDTRAAAAVLRGALPLAAIVAILVGVLLGLALSRALVRRLTLLHADAQALGTEGLAHEVHVVGDDEIADVAAALEQMRTRLAEEEASRQSFVSTASHELRTPLASLQASLELLREEAAGGEQDRAKMVARVDTALRQTHRLAGLAGDLLDLSRVDARADVRAEPVEVRELADLVVREFAERFASAGRTISLRGGDPAIVYGDAGAIVRILRILADNALAYATGAVQVRAAVVDGHAQVSVEDEGPGIAPGERERVFVRFARGTQAREHPGAGLGLPIARALANEMGGDLDAVTAAHGARLELRVPLWHGE